MFLEFGGIYIYIYTLYIYIPHPIYPIHTYTLAFFSHSIEPILSLKTFEAVGSFRPQSRGTELDPSVMKRMPVDLIARQDPTAARPGHAGHQSLCRRLGETVHGNPGQDEKTVVLEASVSFFDGV